MKQNKSVDCFFYKGHPNLTQQEVLVGDTLWIKIEEEWNTIYEKTLRAFQYFTPRLKEYDFVYRTNLSTFTAFDELVAYCGDLPRYQCCAAVTGGIPEQESNRDSLKYPRSFPGGNGFLLSPDLVQRLIEDKEPLDTQDDITIGNALRRWGVRIHEFVRPDFCEDGSWFVNNHHLLKPYELNFTPKKIMFSFRLKSNNRDSDIHMMDKFIRKTYAA